MSKLPCWLKSMVSNKLQAWYLLMQNEFDVKVQEKKDSRFMKLVAFLLGIVRKFVPNVCSPKEFMEDFTTTIYGTVYVSFDPGALDDADSEEEIIHMVHEFTHVEQFRREFLMPLKYVFSSYWRMRYEVEAFCRSIEYLSRSRAEDVDYVGTMNGNLESLKSSYGVGDENMRIAKKLMQASLLRIRNGSEPKSLLVTKALEFWACVNRK